MVEAHPDTHLSPRWLHAWAVLTVCATVVLLGLGSAVTNFRAGMADPAWPTKPTALLDATPEQLRDVRFVIEHSHRLAGYVVGCCAIVLAAGLWLGERRRWLCWLGTGALVGVCIQGLFGGLRVTENVRWGLQFRIVHGSFAPVVLGMLVATALCTSRAWRPVPVLSPRLRRWSLVALGLVYLQVVLGAYLRHTYDPLAQRGHLLVAFAAVAAVVWLTRLALDESAGDKSLPRAAKVLAGLVVLQLLLGVEVWMRMRQQLVGETPDLLAVTSARVAVRTAHVLGGSLVFAATVAAALLTQRRVVAQVAAVRDSRVEEAA
jgi:heme A synthase